MSENKTNMEAIVQDVVKTIEREGNVKAIFGDPVELDSHRIVPVARAHISVGGGGGFGGALEKLAEAAHKLVPAGAGGGGGIDITIEPVGFVSEKDGAVVFTAIEVPPLVAAAE